jgi:hypothetical protein
MNIFNKEEWNKNYLNIDFDPGYTGPLRIKGNSHLVIDLTYACNMACISCNRLSNVKNKPKSNLSVDFIKDTIRDWAKNKHPIRSISVSGGEPTVHPEFVRIIKLLGKYCSLGKIELTLFTNGGKTFEKVKDQIPDNVIVVNSAKQSNIQFHHTFTIAPIDLGIYDPENNPCAESLICGRSLNKNGYFVCPSAGAIDSFLDLKLGISGFENATEEALREKAKDICKYCGAYARSRGFLKNEASYTNEQKVSDFWKNKIKL